MRTKLIAGNWKMNGSLKSSEKLVRELVNLTQNSPIIAKFKNIQLQPLSARLNVAIFPPAIYLGICKTILNGSIIECGGQDISIHNAGAYTGECSGMMLKDIGATFVLVGHSERRQYHLESSELSADKVIAAINSNLKPILCVGENSEQRRLGQTKKIIKKQLEPILKNANNLDWGNIVVAYEPIWAIGTGVAAQATDAELVHRIIRSEIATASSQADKTLILYGGSVKADNAREYLNQPNIDGVLVGGASLNANDFFNIILSALHDITNTDMLFSDFH